MYTPGIEKKLYMCPPLSSRYRIFDPGGHMIRSEHMKSCLAALIRFMLFKGPGSFKNIFKIGGNVDELKAYRLIPLTPPLFFHFTLPLIRPTPEKLFYRALSDSVLYAGRPLIQ